MSPQYFPSRPRIDRPAEVKNPRQHSSNICFDDRDGLIEGKRGNGMGGVFGDPRELLDLLSCARKSSIVSIDNDLRRGVKISCSGVITETLPRMKYVIFRSTRQRGEIGKPV
jgi:hypothetical protein